MRGMFRRVPSFRELFNQRYILTLQKRQCRRDYPVLQFRIVWLAEWKAKRIGNEERA